MFYRVNPFDARCGKSHRAVFIVGFLAIVEQSKPDPPSPRAGGGGNGAPPVPNQPDPVGSGEFSLIDESHYKVQEGARHACDCACARDFEGGKRTLLHMRAHMLVRTLSILGREAHPAERERFSL